MCSFFFLGGTFLLPHGKISFFLGFSFGFYSCRLELKYLLRRESRVKKILSLLGGTSRVVVVLKMHCPGSRSFHA